MMEYLTFLVSFQSVKKMNPGFEPVGTVGNYTACCGSGVRTGWCLCWGLSAALKFGCYT